MSDRPDFTANTALNAVADTLDNLPVSINAQTLGSLAVDIAAQSAGDIDINLNTASDTVTVALGSSTVTLDVNISGSNTTVDTNISGSSTTLDTDIAAQSVGNIDTIINGQVGDVDIRFASQLGNVDINFEDQTGGVESGTEFAAQQGDTLTAVVDRTVAGGDFDSAVLFDNSTGGDVILESLTIASYRNFTDNCRARFTVNVASNVVDDVELSMNPVTAPLVFDPGVRLSSSGDITVLFQNNSTLTSTIEASAVLREL
jgi:hypothetical protein